MWSWLFSWVSKTYMHCQWYFLMHYNDRVDTWQHIQSQLDYSIEWTSVFIAFNIPKNWLWHKRLSHLNFKAIANLRKNHLVTFNQPRLLQQHILSSSSYGTHVYLVALWYPCLFGSSMISSFGTQTFFNALIKKIASKCFSNIKGPFHSSSYTGYILLQRMFMNEKRYDVQDRLSVPAFDEGLQFTNSVYDGWTDIFFLVCKWSNLKMIFLSGRRKKN